MRPAFRFVAALAAFLASCGPEAPDRAPGSSTAASAAALPVPRPAEAAAVFAIDDVAVVHDALKSDTRLGAYLVGRSWGASAVSWAGLPITAAEHVDTAGQLRGAIAVRPIGVGFAVAIPLRNPGALLAVVTAGEGARFRRKPQAGFDEIVLAKGDDGRFRAIAGGFLVVAGSALDLGELTPFVAQPAPLSRAPAAELERDRAPIAWASVDRAALEKMGAPLLARIGPAAAIASTGWKLPVTWAAEIPLRMDKDGSRLALSASLGRLDGTLDAGQLTRLLELPAAAQVGLALFLGESSRSGAATAGADLLSRGPLGGAASAPIAAALEEIAHARGDGVLAAYEHGTTGPLLSGLADIRDEKRARAGIESLIDALGSKAVSAAVEGRGLSVKADATVLERLGDVSRVRVARGEETVSTTFLRLEAGRLAFASGLDAANGLRRVVSQDRGDRLGSVPAVVEMVQALGPEVAGACLLDAAALPFEPPRAGGERVPRWLLATVERRNDVVVGRVLFEPAALSKLLEQR